MHASSHGLNLEYTLITKSLFMLCQAQFTDLLSSQTAATFRGGHALNVPPDRKSRGLRSGDGGGNMFFCQKLTQASLRHTCVNCAVWAGVPSCWNIKSLCFSATFFIHRIRVFWRTSW